MRSQPVARTNPPDGAPAGGASYINVDLEVRSRANVAPLVAALEGPLMCLHSGRERGGYLATFETGGVPVPPDVAIRRMVAAITALSGRAQALWKGSRDRVFDVGLERGAGPGMVAFGLRRETIALAASVGARIAFTIYEREAPQAPATGPAAGPRARASLARRDRTAGTEQGSNGVRDATTGRVAGPDPVVTQRASSASSLAKVSKAPSVRSPIPVKSMRLPSPLVKTSAVS